MRWSFDRRPQASQHESAYVLYHQTSPQNAAAILESNCFKLGPKGFGGSGIYFAVDPLATTCKANHHGVILECTVRLGRVRHVAKAGDWGSKLRRLLFNYDSVALTFLEGGIEYVLYDPARVVGIKLHKVLVEYANALLPSCSSSGSSFNIGTATDPGWGSRSSSSSSSGYASDAGSSGSSVSGDSSYGPATEQPSALCCQQVAPRLGSYTLSCQDSGSTQEANSFQLAVDASKPGLVQDLSALAVQHSAQDSPGSYMHGPVEQQQQEQQQEQQWCQSSSACMQPQQEQAPGAQLELQEQSCVGCTHEHAEWIQQGHQQLLGVEKHISTLLAAPDKAAASNESALCITCF